MEEKEFNEVLELNGRDFLVVKKVMLHNNSYLYLFAMDDTKDFAIVLETLKDGKYFINNVDDENLVKEILMNVALEGIE